MDYMYLIEATMDRLYELSADWEETPLGDTLRDLADNLDAVLTELRS